MKHPILKLGLLLGLVIAIPAGLFYGIFYEKADCSYFVKNENFDSDNFLNGKLVHSFDSTVSEEKICFQITQDDMNQILYRACETNFPDQIGHVLQGMQIQINDKEYVFNLDLKPIDVFSTRLQIAASFEDTGDAFVFHINKIRIGKASQISDIALDVTSTFINDSLISETFASLGLSLQCSLKNRTLTYKKSDLLSDLSVFLSSADSATSFYLSLVDDFVSANLLTADFYSDQAIRFDLDLSPFHTNVQYVTEDKNLTDFTMDLYQRNLKTLLDKDAIDNTNSHDCIALNYLVNGYSVLNDEEKSYLDSVDLSSIGIKKASAYQGYYHPMESISIEKSIRSNFSNIQAEGIVLNEDLVNDYIKTTDLIGTNYALTYKGLGESEYTANYLVMDNAYVNFLNDRMYLTVGVNLNGYETSIILDASVKSKTQYGLILSTDKVLYGTHEINDELKDEVFRLIGLSFSDSGWLTFSSDSGEFTLDFSSILSGPLETSGLKDKMQMDVSIKGEDLNSDGYLLLKGKLIS